MLLASSLENLLTKSIREAISNGFECLTVEHLLLVFLENSHASDLLRHSGADINELRAQLAGCDKDVDGLAMNKGLRLLERFQSDQEPGLFLVDNIGGLSPESVKCFTGKDHTHASYFADCLKQMSPVVEHAIKVCQDAKAETSAVVQFDYADALEKAILLTAFKMITSGRTKIDETDLLIGVIEEGSSTAAWLLEKQGVRLIDLLNYVSHKISKIEGHPVLSSTAQSPGGFLDQFKHYKVILHNDHYTPMDFVVWMLTTEFSKSDAEARVLMKQVHEQGSSMIGKFPFSIVQAKVRHAVSLAQENGFPLLFSIEA